MEIADLAITIQSYNALSKAGIRTTEQLVELEQRGVMRIRGIGVTRFLELQLALTKKKQPLIKQTMSECLHCHHQFEVSDLRQLYCRPQCSQAVRDHRFRAKHPEYYRVRQW